MKVERVEVKRCFVASEKGKEKLRGKTGVAFQMALAEIEKEVESMSEPELNTMISPDWPPRLKKYNELTWYFEQCSIDDIGVWYGSGGLPPE